MDARTQQSLARSFNNSEKLFASTQNVSDNWLPLNLDDSLQNSQALSDAILHDNLCLKLDSGLSC